MRFPIYLRFASASALLAAVVGPNTMAGTRTKSSEVPYNLCHNKSARLKKVYRKLIAESDKK